MLHRADKWAVWLWEYYRPQIESGEPFYLAADSDLILEILRTQENPNYSLQDALIDFHSSCASLMRSTPIRARILEKTFEKIPGRPFSRAICLAVQQVLVVEMMLNDDSYSANSYFPRYRRLLGLDEAYEHFNPLGSDNFQQIWNVLESELKATPGASNTTVTFFAGSGRDLNRQLPLLQALFTSHDLTIVKEKARSLNGTSDDLAILQNLYRIRNQFGPRARRLTATSEPNLRSRLCRQVRSFLSNSDRFSILKTRSLNVVRERLTFAAYLDDQDLLEDRFSVSVQTRSGQPSNQMVEELILRFSMNQGIMLASRRSGYFEVTKDTPLVGEGAVLIILKRILKGMFLQELERMYFPDLPPQFSTAASNLPAEFELLFCDRIQDNKLNFLIGIENVTDWPISNLALEGGVMLDARSAIYLAGYPPETIKLRDMNINPETKIAVSGIQMSAGTFIESLTEVRTFKSYLVEFEGDKISFAISPTSLATEPSMELGFLLENGHLSPTAVPLDSHQPGLRGVVFSDESPQAIVVSDCFTPREIVAFNMSGRRLSLPKLIIDQILFKLRSSPDPRGLANHASFRIESTNSIPLNSITLATLKDFERPVTDID